MKKRRPAGRSPKKSRRTVDRDGVLEVDLRQGRSGRWLYVLVPFLLSALLGLAVLRKPPKEQQRGQAQKSAASEREDSGSRLFSFLDMGLSSKEDTPPPESTPEPEVREPDQEHSGIKLFPAPGTKRIKAGIVVPEDFALPPGYVRHYQTTDKGQMLQAILMFHPDYEPLDAAGNPLPLPPDRVVPAEMAPPGLAIQKLEIPEDAYANPRDEQPEPGETSADDDP